MLFEETLGSRIRSQSCYVPGSSQARLSTLSVLDKKHRGHLTESNQRAQFKLHLSRLEEALHIHSCHVWQVKELTQVTDTQRKYHLRSHRIESSGFYIGLSLLDSTSGADSQAVCMHNSHLNGTLETCWLPKLTNTERIISEPTKAAFGRLLIRKMLDCNNTIGL